MKTTILKRWLLILMALCVLLASPLNFGQSAAYALSEYNSGTRHEVADSLSTQAQAYYTGSNTYSNLSTQTASELKTDLYELMSSTMTNSVSYSSLTGYWKNTDASDGTAGTMLFYSDTQSESYNREHVWPKSRASFYQKNGGSDLHHLRPTNSSINSTRGNLTMGNVRGVLSSYNTASYGGNSVLYYNSSFDLVEVNDNIKGDVARILLYVYVRWQQPNLFENVATADLPPFDSDDNANNGKKVIESLETLLQWIENDPVDTWEMSRNDLCQDVQGNRNVFIDYPEYAWLIFDQQLPSDMPTPSGEAQNSGTSYNITALSSNESHGTVSISGRTITASPNTGYYAEGATVTPSGAATIAQNGNVFTLSNIISDCTVTVQFAQSATVSASFTVPAGVTMSQSSISAYQGEEITLPSVSGTPSDSSHSYSFVGWMVGENTTATTTQPTSFAAGEGYILNTNTSFHALYSYSVTGEGPSNAYYLVSEEEELSAGDKVIIVYKAGDDAVNGFAAGAANSDNYRDSQTVLINSDVINTTVASAVTDTGVYAFTLGGASGAWVLNDPVNQGDLYYSGTGNKVYTGETEEGNKWTFTFASNGECEIKSTAYTRYLQYNSSSPRFACYTGSQKDPYIYKNGAGATVCYLTLGATTPTPTPTATATPTPTPTATPTTSPTPTPTGLLHGDANGNGEVDAADAAHILRWVVRLVEDGDIDKLAADVDDDSFVTAADAAKILRWIVRLMPNL